MKKQFFLLFIIMCLHNVYAEKNNDKIMLVKKEVENINSLKLKKINPYYDSTTKKWIYNRYKEKKEGEESVRPKIYIDSSDKIRKFMVAGEDADGGYRIIEYFDTNGNLCFLLYWSFYSDFVNYGNIYIYNKKIVSINSLEEDDRGNSKKNVMPSQEWGDIRMYHFNVDELMSDYYIDPNKFKYFKYCTFNKARRNSITYINAMTVSFREKSSLKSKIITTLNVSTKVKIISIGKKENINLWGMYHWYKIKTVYNDAYTVGYVFGAFLEPVEVEVSGVQKFHQEP